MNTKATFAIGLGTVGLLALLAVGSAISFYNGAVSQENSIVATYKDSQLQYDKFWKTVKESAQVTDAYKEDFKEIFLGSMDARYDGKDPALSFIMESNPTLDPAAYLQLQRVIESGRADFTRSQSTLVDKQRAYETSIETFPNVVMAGFFDFPKSQVGEYAPAEDIDMDGKATVLDYRIVTSSKTTDVFESGREDEALDVFGD